MGGPGAFAEAHEREAGRQHPSLLRRGGYHVEVPSVGGHGYRGDAADAVHQYQLVVLALDDFGDGLEVVGDAGGGLVVGYGDRFHVGVVVQAFPQNIEVNGLSERKVQGYHIRAER